MAVRLIFAALLIVGLGLTLAWSMQRGADEATNAARGADVARAQATRPVAGSPLETSALRSRPPRERTSARLPPPPVPIAATPGTTPRRPPPDASAPLADSPRASDGGSIPPLTQTATGPLLPPVNPKREWKKRMARLAALPPPKRGPSAQQVQALPSASSAKLSTAPVPADLVKLPPPSAESRHVARLDKAIAPVRDLTLAPAQAKALKAALNAVRRSRLREARQHTATLRDPHAKLLVRWYRLRLGFGRPADYRSFLDEHKDWPQRAVLTRRAEEQLFIQGGRAATIKAFFKGERPQTAAGYAALASAYLATGDEATAAKLARHAWRRLRIASTLETGFLQRFGGLLRPIDHRARIDRFLLNNSRFRSIRRARAAKAKRVITLLPARSERRKIDARIAVYLRQRKAATLMKAVMNPPRPPVNTDGGPDTEFEGPDPLPYDGGLMFQHAQMLANQRRYDALEKALLKAPTTQADLIDPDAWWGLRRDAAKRALRQKRVKTAYALVRAPGPLTGSAAIKAGFLSGWLSLRYLAQPKPALNHFKAMLAAADGPRSRSTALYWMARASATAGDRTGERKHLQAAAQTFQTFYGQLARQRLKPRDHAFTIKPPRAPTSREQADFNSHAVVRAAALAYKAGMGRRFTRRLLRGLEDAFTDEARLVMLAHLAESFGDTQTSLRVAKTGVGRGHNLLYYAYPVHPLPYYEPVRTPPETALLLAIARQESEFNLGARSRVGARGILQIMPGTARQLCRRYRTRCATQLLSTDPAHAAKLAAAYVGDQLTSMKGAYILSLTSYNAGPGRTRQWLRRLGDVRRRGVDTIDWIERIPFDETRNYVKKVLANLQIYRARLGNERHAIQLRADLGLARRPAPVDTNLTRAAKPLVTWTLADLPER
ncbi:MAG: transglycosylase SLT domain-containing protein [Pseudomonadota bacterium]